MGKEGAGLCPDPLISKDRPRILEKGWPWRSWLSYDDQEEVVRNHKNENWLLSEEYPLPEDLKPEEQVFGRPVEKIDCGETSQFLTTETSAD